MNEKEVLTNFLDLTDKRNQDWISLVRESISFMPHEKARFLIDFNTYSKSQVENMTTALKAENKRNKDLEKTHPDKFRHRQEMAQKGWEKMLDDLDEYVAQQRANELKRGLKEE